MAPECSTFKDGPCAARVTEVAVKVEKMVLNMEPEQLLASLSYDVDVLCQASQKVDQCFQERRTAMAASGATFGRRFKRADACQSMLRKINNAAKNSLTSSFIEEYLTSSVMPELRSQPSGFLHRKTPHGGPRGLGRSERSERSDNTTSPTEDPYEYDPNSGSGDAPYEPIIVEPGTGTPEPGTSYEGGTGPTPAGGGEGGSYDEAPPEEPPANPVTTYYDDNTGGEFTTDL